MKKIILGFFLGLVLAAGITKVNASTSSYLSDYVGYRGSDGSNLELVEKEGHIFLLDPMDGHESLLTSFDSADNSQYDIVLR